MRMGRVVFLFTMLVLVGDLVYSYNTATGDVELCEGTSTLAKTTDHINYLTIVDEEGREQVIETTDVHPFWVVTDTPDLDRAAREIADEFYHENLEPGLNGFWVEAKDLRVGDVFLGANGEISTLSNIVRVEQSGGIAVFNFEVEGNHNYFILAKEYDYGQTCILVHNAKYKPKDVHVDSETEAMREVLRRHGVPEENFDLIDRIPDYKFHGPKGQPAEIIEALDKNGNLVVIDHHKWGHIEYGVPPHYQGPKPDSIHIFY